MVCLETNRDHSIVFEITSKYRISDSFVDHDGYSMSSKGFLPTVVNIMVIWVKFTHSSPLLCWFLECRSSMSTFNVDVHSCHLLFDHFQFALIHGPDIPGSYAILLFTAPDLASITSHIHNWYCFCFQSIPSFFLELFLHWSPVAYWALPTWGVPLLVSYHSAFSYCFWGSQGMNTEVVCHSLLQWTTFCQTSPPWPACLGWPHTTWLSFIALDKAVVRVIRLTSFLWLWFQCVCPLMPSRNTYRLTWVSLTLDVGYLFMANAAKRSHCSLPWMRVSPHGRPFWPWTWSSSSQPFCAGTATTPRMLGSSSRPPPLTSDTGYLTLVR